MNDNCPINSKKKGWKNNSVCAVQVSLQSCTELCDAESSCAGFVYDTRDPNGVEYWCYLKSAICQDPTPTGGVHTYTKQWIIYFYISKSKKIDILLHWNYNKKCGPIHILDKCSCIKFELHMFASPEIHTFSCLPRNNISQRDKNLYHILHISWYLAC